MIIANMKTAMKLQARKTFNMGGRWVHKASSAIITCKCGNRYIKTRTGQHMCLKCMFPN